MQRPSKISTQLILMFKELNEFFAEIKQEAAEFAESFRSNPRMLEAHMNDILCGNPQGERPEPPGAQACAPETRTGGRIDNTSTNIKISRYTFFGVYGSFL